MIDEHATAIKYVMTYEVNEVHLALDIFFIGLSMLDKNILPTIIFDQFDKLH